MVERSIFFTLELGALLKFPRGEYQETHEATFLNQGNTPVQEDTLLVLWNALELAIAVNRNRAQKLI